MLHDVRQCLEGVQFGDNERLVATGVGAVGQDDADTTAGFEEFD